MFTPKQERNGTAVGADGHNTAVAAEGPMPAIPMAEATAVGVAYADKGRQVFDGGTMDGVSFEWDAGLAVNDVEGGGSG